MGFMELLVDCDLGLFFLRKSDLCTSDVWPAMDGVVSLLTEVSHDEAKMKDLP